MAVGAVTDVEGGVVDGVAHDATPRTRTSSKTRLRNKLFFIFNPLFSFVGQREWRIANPVGDHQSVILDNREQSKAARDAPH